MMQALNTPYKKEFNKSGILTNSIHGMYCCGYTDPNGHPIPYPNRRQRRAVDKSMRRRGAATNGVKGYTINPIPVRKRK